MSLASLVALFAALFVGAPDTMPQSGQQVDQDRLAAAMTAQLLSFVEWPTVEARPVVIGVFDDAATLAVFEALLQDRIYNGRYATRLVRSEDPDSSYADLSALYFPKAAPREVPRILRRFEAQPILLIGAFDGFLEMGGMVNFTRHQRRLGFEINLVSARHHGIQFRAKLLRLATRIIEQ